ncbi:TolC family protein [Aquisphaera giovannonii]|uniref:TolC family protein n=1 Tax=Aquisphaera giovannonii TaxID=406548 RepID=UPI001AEF7998|nr:TolC family protein [Aquisphaera giovannonii]
MANSAGEEGPPARGRDPRVVPARLESAREREGPDRPEVSAAPLPPGGALEDEPRPSAVPGAMPLDACIRAALDGNATVRAARFNVEALRQRIPQVTALDDPILSNSIYPIPSVAPQYSLMGYMPYGALLAQQFPWCGTLRLRGLAAEKDVRIALFELAATELDAVAATKRAYHDLRYAERAEVLLIRNRKLASEFLEIARARYPTATASQPDVLRSEVAVTDIDREIEDNRAALADARAELARVMHADPEAELRTAPDLAVEGIPQPLDRLYQLALSARPDLQGRLAAIDRDEAAVALARKKAYPNVTLGVLYQDMEKTNAMTPQTAGGMPNVGLFVGMNLPVYRKKIAAGVCEAQARAAADRALYEAERDQSRRDIKALFALARSQQNVLAILRRSNLPAARQMLRLTASEYRSNVAGVDFLSVAAAWRDLLQVELQVARSEAELGKTIASLERGVGVQLNDSPPPAAAGGGPRP